MSKELELKLNESDYKPLFKTVTKFNRKISCLFDTGATMPVWCGSKGLFDFIFPDAKLYDKDFILSGFGKTPEIVSVYRIPLFSITDHNGNRLRFENMYVAVSFGRDFGCDLVLSYTMFKHMEYSILNRNTEVSLLKIKYDRDTYYVTPVTGNSGYIKRISNFVSENTLDGTNLEVKNIVSKNGN